MENLTDRVHSRRAEVSRVIEFADLRSPARTGSKVLIGSSGNLPSIKEEKTYFKPATKVLNELERRKKIDESLEHIRHELVRKFNLNIELYDIIERPH